MYECISSNKLLKFFIIYQAKNFTTQTFAAVVSEGRFEAALTTAEALGTDLANRMLASGADEILRFAKKQTADEILKQKAAKAATAAQEQAKA